MGTRAPRVGIAMAASQPKSESGLSNPSLLETAYERVRQYARQLEHSQLELSRQSSVLNSVLESISDGVAVADCDGRLQRFNAAAEDIVGLGLTDAPLDDWPQRYGCFLPDGVTPFPAHELPLARALRGEASYDVEIFIRNAVKPEGLWISVNAAPLRDGSGHLIGGVAAFRDISARKRMEEALRAAAAELVRSNHDLQQFAYVVSHDLQKPLRKVSRFCQLLEKHCASQLDDEAERLLGFIVDSASRMEGLIHHLLTYARVGRGGQRAAPVDLNVVFRQALDDCVSVPEARPEVVFGPLPTVEGDATQLGQLALNLLDNALKYRAERPPVVHVTAERQGGAWVIAVADNGIGISPEDLRKIFEVFERGHADPVYPGTGLGLAICKRIVENHGGRIWAESTPGQGTTFYFTLPVHSSSPLPPGGRGVGGEGVNPLDVEDPTPLPPPPPPRGARGQRAPSPPTPRPQGESGEAG
jgi:signal transduction histidine kinase